MDTRLKQIRSTSETSQLVLSLEDSKPIGDFEYDIIAGTTGDRGTSRVQNNRGKAVVRAPRPRHHLQHRMQRDEHETYGEILDRRSKCRVLDSNRYTPRVRERVHGQLLGRSIDDVQQHKWRSCAVEKRNSHRLVTNTANGEPEFRRSSIFRPDDQNC